MRNRRLAKIIRFKLPPVVCTCVHASSCAQSRGHWNSINRKHAIHNPHHTAQKIPAFLSSLPRLLQQVPGRDGEIMLPTVARRVVPRTKTPAAAAAATAGAVRCISVGGCVPNVKVKEVRREAWKSGAGLRLSRETVAY